MLMARMMETRMTGQNQDRTRKSRWTLGSLLLRGWWKEQGREFRHQPVAYDVFMIRISEKV
jgi:hypothetical protein